MYRVKAQNIVSIGCWNCSDSVACFFKFVGSNDDLLMIELEIGTIVVSYVSVALICLSMYIVDKKIIYYCIWAHTPPSFY
jgi:hypothetical protein